MLREDIYLPITHRCSSENPGSNVHFYLLLMITNLAKKENNIKEYPNNIALKSHSHLVLEAAVNFPNHPKTLFLPFSSSPVT